MLLGIIALGAALAMSSPAFEDRKPTIDDIRRYAMATCLTFQPSEGDYLKHQGEYANSILLEQIGGVVFQWAPIGNAVQAELSAEPPYMVHVDAPVAESTKAAPIAQCMFIADTPRVRAAIVKAAMHPGRQVPR